MRLSPWLAATLMCGCIVLPVKTREAGLGRVIDGENAEPVAGARVLVPSWRRVLPEGTKGGLAGVFRATTDAEGYFRVPSGSKWSVIPAADGRALFTSGLCIEKEGYEALAVDPFAAPEVLHPPSIEIKGTYYLKRSTAGVPCPPY